MGSEIPAESRAARRIAAELAQVYAAFLDPQALAQWLPPAQMTGTVHAFDGRVGGGYEMSLFYPPDDTQARGKTTDREDRVRVRFVALEPPTRIVEAVTFVTEDPVLQGEMTLTASFAAADGGTEVVLSFRDLPPGLKPADNDLGAALSLEQLARRFEG